MALLDLLGRRWTMRVLWELSISTRSFRDLQTSCDNVSSSVLNTRLNELKESRLVELDSEGYRLSLTGSELLKIISPLREWADTWGHELSEQLLARSEAGVQ